MSAVARVRRQVTKQLRKVFPDHWSFLFGEVALYSFVVLLVTGVVLAFWYDASGEAVRYQGSYEPMQGREVTRAYASVLEISFDRRGGLLLRQVHHWAAIVFVAAIALHACRIFFTGAFRRPRRFNWTIGVTLLLLAITNGFFGLSLPHDLLGGMGTRIFYATVLAVPLIGPQLVLLIFGGPFPTDEMFARIFTLHVFVIPGAIALLLAVHLGTVFRQTHTQFAGGRRREGNVVGDTMWPRYLVKTTALMLGVAGVLVALGTFVQIAPVWLYGPFVPGAVTVPAQPDWYLGWVEGALRVLPSMTVQVAGREIPSPFFTGALLPALVFVVLYLWPFIEERVTHDRRLHHILDRPRDRPARTGIGAAALGFLGVLLFAGSHDVQGQALGVSVEGMTNAYRLALVAVPPVVGVVVWRLCHELVNNERVALDIAAGTPPGPAPGGSEGGPPSGRRAVASAGNRQAGAGPDEPAGAVTGTLTATRPAAKDAAEGGPSRGRTAALLAAAAAAGAAVAGWLRLRRWRSGR